MINLKFLLPIITASLLLGVNSSFALPGTYTRIHCSLTKPCSLSESVNTYHVKPDFIFIGDSHEDERIRKKMMEPSFLEEIQSMGVRSYAIEAPATLRIRKFIKDFNQEKRSDLSSNSKCIKLAPLRRTDFLEVIQKMHNLKLSIIPIDHPKNIDCSFVKMNWPSSYSRELYITNRLISAHTQSDAPVLVLIGDRHATLSMMNDPEEKPVSSTADQLMKLGFNVLSVAFEGTDVKDFYDPY